MLSLRHLGLRRFLTFLAPGAFLLVMPAPSHAAVVPPDAQVVAKYSSLFNGDLSVVDHGDNRYLLAQSRLGLMLQSSINLTDKRKLQTDYIQIMALLTGLHPHPERVFNLGMGGGALPRFHLGKYPSARIDSVEIDPTVVEIARKFFFVDDPRHHILVGDGYDVLKRQNGKYDVIWVDAHDPKEGPTAFLATEDLNILRDHLKEGGMIVANLDMSTCKASKAGGPVYGDHGYKRYYSHGILIQSPKTQISDTMAMLRKAVHVPSSDKPAFMPSAVIAVGNSPNLTCARFRALYRSWQAAPGSRTSVHWSEDAKEICHDLR